jgi:hypothetical protein
MAFYKEWIKNIKKVGTRLALSILHLEEYHRMKGQIFIRGYENGNLVLDFMTPNVIVNTASILVARLLKDSKEPSNGIAYLAVGTGDPGWNLQDPPAPTTTQTQLVSELFRKAVTESFYIDPVTGGNAIDPTNIVDYHFNFNESEAVGAIVELGLFGGDATDGLNTGTMVNYRTFPVLNKTNSMAFVIIVRITT